MHKIFVLLTRECKWLSYGGDVGWLALPQLAECPEAPEPAVIMIHTNVVIHLQLSLIIIINYNNLISVCSKNTFTKNISIIRTQINKFQNFERKPHHPQLAFMPVLYPGRIEIWRCWEGGKSENLEKNPWCKARINNKLNPLATGPASNQWHTICILGRQFLLISHCHLLALKWKEECQTVGQ